MASRSYPMPASSLAVAQAGAVQISPPAPDALSQGEETLKTGSQATSEISFSDWMAKGIRRCISKSRATIRIRAGSQNKGSACYIDGGMSNKPQPNFVIDLSCKIEHVRL